MYGVERKGMDSSVLGHKTKESPLPTAAGLRNLTVCALNAVCCWQICGIWILTSEVQGIFKIWPCVCMGIR
jgi:hypothetical protein